MENITENKDEKLFDRIFKFAFDSNQDGIAIFDLEGRLEFANNAYLELFGYLRHEEIKGLNLNRFFPAEETGIIIEGIEKGEKGETTRLHDVRALMKNGKVVPVAVYSFLVFDDDGNKTGLMCSVRDITERKKAEDALRESEEKWSSLVKNAPNFIIIADRDHKIQFVNHTVPGDSKKETIGRSVYEFIPPEYHEVARETIEKAFQTGETGGYETMGPGPHGSIGWYNTQAGPIMQDDKVVAVTLIATDITEHKRAEEEIKSAHAEMNQIFQTAADGMQVVDKDFNVLRVNEAFSKLAGLKKDEAVGKKCYDIFAGPSCRTHQCSLKRILEGEKRIEMDVEKLRSDGTGVPCLLTATPLRLPDGDLIGVVQNFKDMSGRKKAEEELRKKTHDLSERVKELNCLYGIADFVERKGADLDDIFQGTVELIPPALQFPEITCARIQLEGKIFKTANFKKSQWEMKSDIFAYDKSVGSLEVFYSEEIPEVYEGPFLKEERMLINAISERLSRIIERKRTEEALRESEIKHRTLVENIPQKIFTKDRNSTYIACNENLARDFGITPEEFAGKTDHDFFPKELAGKYRADDRRIMESGETEEIDEEYIQEGQKRIIHTVKTPIRDENGNVSGVMGIFWDITEKKLAEEALRESEALLINAQSIAHLGHWDWNIITNELYWSDEIYRIFGLKTQEFGATYEAFLNSVHPEDRGFVQEKVNAAVNENAEYNIDHRILLPGGEVRHVHEQGDVTRDEKGNPTRMIGTVIDITERMRGEEAMRESEERYRSLVFNVPGAVYRAACDPEKWTIEFFSDAIEDILGYPASDFIGDKVRTYASAIHPDDASIVEEIVLDRVEKRAPFELEYRVICADGSNRWVYDKGQGIFDEDGQLLWLDGVVYDITERRRAEEERERMLLSASKSEKLASVGQLAAGMAHEINNPIAFVGANLSVLQEYHGTLAEYIDLCFRCSAELDDETKKALKGYLGRINRIREKIESEDILEDTRQCIEESLDGVQRITKIVKGLLNYAEAKVTGATLTDLNEVLDNILEFAGNGLKHKAAIIKEFSDIPGIKCVPNEIGQVFLNIINNAAQAIREKGEIRVKTSRNNSHVLVEISDTGVGMTGEQKRKIFDPFYTAKEGGGTGLGMSVSYGIIKAHGGNISVESEPGKGSRFIIQIPIHADERDQQETIGQ